MATLFTGRHAGLKSVIIYIFVTQNIKSVFLIKHLKLFADHIH